jgi:hypothetical protein
MKTPWTNKTGPAKFIAFFVTTLLVALGLCGMNYAAFSLGTSHLHPRAADAVTLVLIIAAYIELAVMILSFAGLLITGLVWLLRVIWAEGQKRN